MRFTIFMRAVLAVVLFVVPAASHAYDEILTEDKQAPALADDKNYKEYWEQYFVFEDGSLLTTQFTILNLPFMTHRALMLATFTRPDGKKYIIKNGRSRDDWEFTPDHLDIQLNDDIQHYIRKTTDGYQLKLHNSTGEIELDLKSPLPPLEALNSNNKYRKKGELDVVTYAPKFVATGRFRPGHDACQCQDAPWENMGTATGFGMRVFLDESIDEMMENWLRVFSLENGSEAELMLSSINLPNRKQDNKLFLREGNKVIGGFHDVKVVIQETAEDPELGEYPTKVRLVALNGTSNLQGTIDFTRKLEHFRLTDHMSSLERMLAQAFPSVTSYRYVAEYNLVYSGPDGIRNISGKALSDYADIFPPSVKKKKTRKKR
ncbi:hypothetical protein [Emcibacter sp.]|uniref:hypothetical protein n=1 Tax=Emcibacter sp. TaxID=1979954 RepID=UPI002AA641FF|nr:hypothetical protein [Emcibacter sp.]